MTKYHLPALNEMKVELRETVNAMNARLTQKIELSDAVLDKFIARFDKDYRLALTPSRLRAVTIRAGSKNEQQVAEFAECAWPKVREAVLLKTHAIAALAVSFARQERRAAVTEQDLVDAGKQARKSCTIRTGDGECDEPKVKVRFDFCQGAFL